MGTICGTILVAVCMATCANAADGGNGLSAGRANIDLNSGWRFMRGDVEGAEAPGFDDSGWKCVPVPHDWAIEGPFDKTNDMQFVKVVQDGETRENLKLGRTGALPWVGAGWYRRWIVIPPGAAHVELEFDGAMSDSKVYVDGRLVGGRPNGYVPFTVDISDVVSGAAHGARHLVAVRLENAPKSSRWYPGAGLNRPVRLVVGPRTGLATWGTFVRTVALGDGVAKVAVTDEVRNPHEGLSVSWRILDADGNEVASSVAKVSDGAANGGMPVTSPQLWSPESPGLYLLESELRGADGAVLDLRRTRFGIRTVEVSESGFLLNGRRFDFRGVCLHHDLGSIGAAFNPSAFRRQVRIMKEMGANAIRTSHNSPCPDQIAICDEMGMMVMAESFDEWKTPKCANGYNRFFDEWWMKDLSNIVRRFRSSPSVVMWSIGNEIWEDDPRMVASCGRAMLDLCHRLDPTRPVTQGVDRPDEATGTGVLQQLDLPGINYRLPKYGLARKASRTGLVLGSETASTVSTRGEYFFPDEEGKGVVRSGSQCSSYDLECCPWSNLPDDDFAMQEDNAWTVGEFVWTGFDYLGEPTPYGAEAFWPSRSAYFGIVDLAGIPKDRYWLYRSHWNKAEPTLHVLPHWTWLGREGEDIPVYVYTSWPSAELFVNGVSQGRRTKEPASRLERYRLRWRKVRYEPGELRVVAYDVQGRAMSEKTVKTAGRPCRIELVPETPSLHATPTKDGEPLVMPELGYVRVRIVDADGNLCPHATNDVSFAVSGAAKFKGLCNGDPTSTEPFILPRMRAFHGEMTLVVEVGRSPGAVNIKASSASLESAAVVLGVE